MVKATGETVSERRVQPHDLEAEKSLLGIAILEPKRIPDAIGVVSPEDFYGDKNKEIFKAIVTLATDNKDISLASIYEQLGGKVSATEIGKLVDGIQAGADIYAYGRIVKEKANLRRIIQASQKLAMAAYDGDTDGAVALISGISAQRLTSKREHTLVGDVRKLVDVTSGDFSLAEILKSLDSVTNRDRTNVRQILHRLKVEGVIERSGRRDGIFRKVESDLEVMDFVNAPTDGLAFDWPLDLHGVATVFPKDICCIAGFKDSGKGHPNGTPILTPNGWIPIENVSVGDTVFSGDGTQTKITGVFPRGPQQCFEFVFNDRTSIVCDWEHLWDVQFDYYRHYKLTGRKSINRHYQQWETFPTYKLLGRCGLGKIRPGSAFVIPRVRPIEIDGSPLPLDPYVLGVLLGDGCFKKGTTSLSTADKNIIDSVKNVGIKIGAIDRGINYNLKGLNPIIRDLGLSGHRSWEKFIPKQYLFNSIDNRLSILRGLMDTDGDISKNGKTVCYSTTSKELNDGVKFLVESLGGKVVVSERFTHFIYKNGKKTGRLSYRLFITLKNFCPFSLSRKVERYKPTSKKDEKTIIEIKNAGIMNTTCLSVDHKSGLYIVRDFIVTHNTAFAVDFIRRNMDKREIYYFNCEMSSSRLRDRLSKVDDVPITGWKFHPYSRSDNFSDVIKPNDVNIIDYLELVEEHWLVAKRMKEIHNKLDQGIAIVLLQKPRGRDTGMGGDKSLQKPTLYVALENGQAKIVSAKTWKGETNPNKMIVDFKLVHGWKFVMQGPWHSEDAEEAANRALGTRRKSSGRLF